MTVKPRSVGIVKKTTFIDKSDIYVAKIDADSANEFNNNLHFHSFYELEFIISGKGGYEINNTDYEIKPGALFMVTPADYHTYSLSAGETIRFIGVQFYAGSLSDTVASRLYSYAEPIALDFTGEQRDEMRRRLEALTEIFERKEPMYELMLKNEIENLCICVIREMDKQSGATSVHPVVKSAIIYVKDHYRERITLRGAAEYVGLSETYFSHMFATVTGMGFFTYVRRVRLDAAANLIKSTELSIKEICYETGFSNTNYFSDAFRLQFGVPPRQYRCEHSRRGSI